MDLRAGAARAWTWNPFGALITPDPLAEDPTMRVTPFWDFLGHDAMSAALHEITHLWCARHSRLGWLLGRGAAEVLPRWLDDRTAPVVAPSRVLRLLAAYAPWLEGLATYAQLDYEFQEADREIASPLPLLVEAVASRTVHSYVRWAAFLRTWRDAAAFTRDGRTDMSGVDPAYATTRHGLLELMFLRRGDPADAQYLVGYLYVKALQAFLTRRAPAFANPGVFLPLAVRLLCHHPVLDRSLGEDLDPEDIIGSVHAGIQGLSVADVRWLAELVTRHPRVRSDFDAWDVHATLARGPRSEPAFTDSEVVSGYFPEHLPDHPDLLEWATIARGAAQLLIPAWRRGRLVAIRANGLDLEVADGRGRVRVECPPVSGFWAKYPSRPELAQPFKVAAGEMESLRRDCVRKLGGAVGEEIVVAVFLSAADANSGFAFWRNGHLTGWYPSTPHLLLDQTGQLATPVDRAAILLAGLELSPADRAEFARSIPVTAATRRVVTRATDALAALLVSDPSVRQDLVVDRLAYLFPRHAAELATWCRFQVKRRPLGATLVADISRVINCPGFSVEPGLGPINFDELVPLLTPAPAPPPAARHAARRPVQL